MEQIEKSVEAFVDTLEVEMGKMEQIPCPLKHIFTPGLYVRQIFMPGGTVVISKRHKTVHPYIVSMGCVSVYNSEINDTIFIEAPFTGITMPGTRRVLNCHTDVIWTTVHRSDLVTGEENNWSEEEKEALVLKIEDVIIERKEGILSHS